MNQSQGRSLFREHALQQYMDKNENDLLPDIVSPPIFLMAWIFLGLIMISGLLAWMERIPVFVNSSGVTLASGQKINPHQMNAHVIVFFPASSSMQLHVGMHGSAQFNASHQSFDGIISRVDPLVLSPEALQKQYHVSCNAVQNVAVPSIAVTMLIIVPSNTPVVTGAPLQVQVQMGSQRVLDLLPLFHQITGDS